MSALPTAGQRLRYALGARLPAAQREWVRHDLMDSGWRLRVLLRVAVQTLPAVVLFLLLPAPLSVSLLVSAFVVLGTLFVGGAYGDDLRDRRLRQHGLPIPVRDTGPDVGPSSFPPRPPRR